MKMIEVGKNMDGDSVYNVTNDDGSLVSTTIFTKEEAEKMINIQSDIKTEIIEVDSFNNKNYKEMTKKELETFMRTHDIELDRRKTKSDLLQQVDDFFKEE